MDHLLIENSNLSYKLLKKTQFLEIIETPEIDPAVLFYDVAELGSVAKPASNDCASEIHFS